jgi:hypothetical protein
VELGTRPVDAPADDGDAGEPGDAPADDGVAPG